MREAGAFWRGVDWQRPWLQPYRDGATRVARRLEAGDSVADALNLCVDDAPIALVHGSLRFVEHGALPPGEAYEAFIHRTARVPTRDNLHDLFNGLVWLAFAELKRSLNELQAGELRRAGGAAQGRRGALRDALTLFDENAALVQAPQAIVDALRERDWHALFVTRRALWREARVTLFGHALLDKLCAPRKAITAHAWCADAPAQALGGPALARLLRQPRSWLPLPVLGIPGWWPANEVPGFYADAAVFRAGQAAAGPAKASAEPAVLAAGL